MNELEAYEYLQQAQVGLADGETITEKGWVLKMSNGKLEAYIEPIDENAFGKMIFDSSRGIVIETSTGEIKNFGFSEEGLDHAEQCMFFKRFTE